jgi:signal transduction histidine kinase
MHPPIDSVRTPRGDSSQMELAEDLRTGNDASRKRIEELESLLSGQARARCELVHMVSHELRTPITVISGFARLIQDGNHGELNSEQRRFADEILKACGRLDNFVGDLLEASPDLDTPFSVEPVSADLHETLEAQFESLAPILEEHGVKVEARLRASPSKLAFDTRRIEQVVTNLLTNAIRYGRNAGVIRIATTLVPQGDGSAVRDFFEVSVEDDGPGIPEADRERLFEPYVRGQIAEEKSGLGIGLAISQRIIHAHGGRIWVEASEFGGARFVFSLPREVIADGEG